MSELLKINVNDHIEKKNNLSYLSWAWAWAEVLKLDPNARWHATEYGDERGCALPCMFLPDGSAMVKTEVTIKGETKTCMLPVMDHRNKAIKNPDAFAINTAIMRCMTKAISMHGLGLYIYAGEDLPEGEEPAKQETVKAPIITPTSGVQVAMERTSIVLDTAEAIKERFASDDVIGAYELYQSITDNDERVYLWKQLPSHIRSTIKAHGESLKPKKPAKPADNGYMSEGERDAYARNGVPH